MWTNTILPSISAVNPYIHIRLAVGWKSSKTKKGSNEFVVTDYVIPIAVYFYRKMFLYKRLASIWDIATQPLPYRFTVTLSPTRKKRRWTHWITYFRNKKWDTHLIVGIPYLFSWGGYSGIVENYSQKAYILC